MSRQSHNRSWWRSTGRGWAFQVLGKQNAPIIWTIIEKTMVMADIKTSRARPRQHPVQSEGKEDGEQGNDVGPVARTEALSAPPDGVLGKNKQIRNQGREQHAISECAARRRLTDGTARVAIATAIQGLKTSSPRFGLKRVPSAPSSRFVDQMPDTPWKRAVKFLETGLPPQDRAEKPEVIAEQDQPAQNRGRQEPEKTTPVRPREPGHDGRGEERHPSYGR